MRTHDGRRGSSVIEEEIERWKFWISSLYGGRRESSATKAEIARWKFRVSSLYSG
jgi:hypothetical protein